MSFATGVAETAAPEFGRLVTVSPDSGTVYVVVERRIGCTAPCFTITAFRA